MVFSSDDGRQALEDIQSQYASPIPCYSTYHRVQLLGKNDVVLFVSGDFPGVVYVDMYGCYNGGVEKAD
jgi:hypothetical protein